MYSAILFIFQFVSCLQILVLADLTPRSSSTTVRQDHVKNFHTKVLLGTTTDFMTKMNAKVNVNYIKYM